MLGSTLAHPDDLPGLAVQNLRETIERPAAGPPGPPARLRVATDELAGLLRPDFPDIEIVVAPTPELDGVAASLAEFVAAGPPDPGWLGEGLSADAVAAFFDAMAALWKAAPWTSVPGDDALFAIDVEALGVHGAVAVVIGQMGESFGVLLFDSADDRDRYATLGEAMQRGDLEAMAEIGSESGMPAHTALSFDPIDDVMLVRREERETHGWPLADDAAFPSLACVGANLQPRPPAPEDLRLAEALARAFVHVAGDAGFEAAWFDGEPVERTLRVSARGGEIEVRLRAPVDDDEAIPKRDPDAVPERVHRLNIDLEWCNGVAPDTEVSRTVEFAGGHTLWDLHRVIQQAFSWGDDHLFEFFVSGKLRDRKSRYPGTPDGDLESWFGEDFSSVTETTLDALGLKRRRVMRYVFDEHIVHRIAVATIRDGVPEDVGLPRQVAAKGEAPPESDHTDDPGEIVEE